MIPQRETLLSDARTHRLVQPLDEPSSDTKRRPTLLLLLLGCCGAHLHPCLVTVWLCRPRYSTKKALPHSLLWQLLLLKTGLLQLQAEGAAEVLSQLADVLPCR